MGVRSNPIISIAALLLAGLSLVSCRGEKEPLGFTITFQNARNLQPGQFVVYSGLRIGEVRDVDLTDTGAIKVKVEIEPEYRKHVYREAVFIIEKPNGMVDVSGERQITVKDRGSKKTEIAEADILSGTEPLLDRMKEVVRHTAADAVDVVGKVGNVLGKATESVAEMGAE